MEGVSTCGLSTATTHPVNATDIRELQTPVTEDEHIDCGIFVASVTEVPLVVDSLSGRNL